MLDTKPWRTVLWPGALTLGVTLLRLTGEFFGWSAIFFSRSVGGGASLVGIIWLVPVVGAYLGYRLASRESVALTLPRALGWTVAALLTLVSFLAFGFSRPTASASQLVSISVGSWAAIWVSARAWPPLTASFIRYGLLARAPVVVIVLLGILGDWRTHYDTPPPGLPEMSALARWIAIGVIPQLTLWMAVTVVFGALAALPAIGLARRLHAQPSPA